MKKLELTYMNGYAANQYAFVPMPLMLIDHPAYATLGAGEKILYTLMLNRLTLSGRNNDKFSDASGSLYIIYTVQQVCESMNCSKPTAIKYLGNLTEIGLIERVRQGQGKPTIIYIKDFASVQITPGAHKKLMINANKKEQELRNFTSRGKETLLQEVKDFDSSKINSSELENSNLSIKAINHIGKRKNIVLSPESVDVLREDYGTRFDTLLDECSDRIFSRASDSGPIKNYYRYIQTIAKTLGYKTEAEIKAEKAVEEKAKMEKKEEEDRRLQELMKEYGVADEETLNEKMRLENIEQVKALHQKLGTVFK